MEAECFSQKHHAKTDCGVMQRPSCCVVSSVTVHMRNCRPFPGQLKAGACHQNCSGVAELELQINERFEAAALLRDIVLISGTVARLLMGVIDAG